MVGGGAQAAGYGSSGTWAPVSADLLRRRVFVPFFSRGVDPAWYFPPAFAQLICCVHFIQAGGAADDDDALWSDDESDGEGADFRTAAAILESALPDIGDDEEWATDSEEEFE